MGFSWKKFRDIARAAGTVMGSLGVKVKGVPVSEIQDVAEREGQHIADAVKDIKKKPQPAGSPGD